MGKLTIGMCVYDDFDGFYFTLQSLRLHHKEAMKDCEFVILNNNPKSQQGRALRDFVSSIQEPYQYIEFTKYSSTALRNKLAEVAETPYFLCMDCHVLVNPGAIKKLIDYYDAGLDDGNILHGPLIHDDLRSASTHFDDTWNKGMQGQWGTDPQYVDEFSEPFEIHAQGMGLFSSRTDSWLGFNKNFRGFGGEEVYIHNKYRLFGKKAICLPFLQWAHRFVRIHGAPYPNKWEDRYRNYIIGRLELGMDFDDVDAEFSKYIPENKRQNIKTEAALLFSPQQLPPQQHNNNTTNNAVVTPSKILITPVSTNCGCGKS